MEMISIDNVSKSFKGKKAVNRLSLSVKKGEIYGLLGPNGAGKSTTISMLLGFLPADEGGLKVNGLDMKHYADEARKSIGYVPENVRLYPYLTGIENLDYFCKLAGLHYDRDELSAFLSSCGLQQDAHHKRSANYSKGMQQKVGVAIAYAKMAKVYLLDEPASGLDPVASNELSSLIKSLAHDGACILMVTHDLFRVCETCHRVGIIKQGMLVKEVHTKNLTISALENIYLTYS